MTVPAYEPGSLLLRQVPPAGIAGVLPLLLLAGGCESYVRAWCDEGDVFALVDTVADPDEPTLGAALLVTMPGARVLDVRALAVDPAHRGRGLGRQLVQGVADVARARGVRRLVAATSNADTAGMMLFQRAGFRFSHIERDACKRELGWNVDQATVAVPARDLVWFDLEL